jgi:F0F1-type ATP synthase assembly protein I
VTGAAVLVVVLVILVARGSWKHSNSGASLAALLGLVIAVWLIFAVASPSGGELVAVDAGEGVKALAVGLGHILATF